MSAPDFTPQLLVTGPFGAPTRPTLAWDFLGGESYNEARKAGKINGVVRLGPRARGEKGADQRPLILAPRTEMASINSAGAWSRTRGASSNGTKIKTLPSTFGGGAGLQFIDNSFPNEWEFKSPPFLMADEGFGIRAFISDVSDAQGDKNAKGHVVYARWGVAGRGWKLQVLDGNIELLHLSRDWNEVEEKDLHQLWQLSEPTNEETALMETRAAKLYDVRAGLSFEGGFGRDEWRGNGWAMLVIPEPRGASESGSVHFLLEGGAGAVVDLAGAGDFIGADGIGRPPVGNLWDAGPVWFGGSGGAADWQILNVRYNSQGTLEWGPYKTLFGTEDFEGLSKDTIVTGGAGTSATIEEETLDELRFKFKGTLSTTNTRYTPFLHALNAGIPNGPRVEEDGDVMFDSLDLPKDTQPITNISLRVDESGIRSVNLSVRDVNGNTTGGRSLDYFAGFLATFKLGGVPWLTNGVLLDPRSDEMKRLAVIPPSGTPLQGGKDTANPETSLDLTIDQGNWLDSDILCDPPLILDGLYLGEAVRRLKRRAGWTDAELARIPPDIGPRLPKPRPGEGFCYVVDAGTSVESAIGSLMDRFGDRLRYGRDPEGVWFLETPSTTIKYAFTSNGLLNDPHLLRGGTRHMELRPLGRQLQNQNYHTIFKVEGGAPGRKITRSFVNKSAVTMAAGGLPHSRYRGHHRCYPTLTDEGLRDEASVNYALRSLVWRYGRPGRLVQFLTFLHEDLLPLDRVTVDGILCEVVSWEAQLNADERERQQLRLREVVS